jgi:hypothetical protein
MLRGEAYKLYCLEVEELNLQCKAGNPMLGGAFNKAGPKLLIFL